MIEHSELPLTLLEETAVSAARAGASVLLDRWRGIRHVEFKGEIDLVTDADRQSEQAVVSFLRSRFPDHEVLAEEGSTGGASPIYRWIVDPLDGTTNYAHGYPHFAVSVAVEHEGKVLAGAVYDPLLDEMFQARVGGGAFLNGAPISPSRVDQLLQALVGMGFPYDRRLFGAVMRRFNYFARRCQGMRRDGSAALDICYVAAGRLDAFYEDHLYPWDVAAGILIAREAGCAVTDFLGRPAEVYGSSIVATNGHLHPAILAGLDESDRRAAHLSGARRFGKSGGPEGG